MACYLRVSCLEARKLSTKPSSLSRIRRKQMPLKKLFPELVTGLARNPYSFMGYHVKNDRSLFTALSLIE